MFTLLISLLLSFSAQAKLTTLCETTVVRGDEMVRHDSFEVPLNLAPYERNEFRSQARFDIPGMDDFAAAVSILESLDGDVLDWHTQLVLFRKQNKNIVARGERSMNLKLPDGYLFVICNSLDKTESMVLPSPTADAREKARLKFLAGPGPAREYIDKSQKDQTAFTFERGDLYDLYLQLLAQPTTHGELLRTAVEGLLKQKFKPVFLTNYTQGWAELTWAGEKCNGPGGEYICDVETLTFSLDFAGWMVNDKGEKIQNEIELHVSIELYRDAKSRLIKGYRIKSIGFTPAEGRGGSASTSGGR